MKTERSFSCSFKLDATEYYAGTIASSFELTYGLFMYFSVFLLRFRPGRDDNRPFLTTRISTSSVFGSSFLEVEKRLAKKGVLLSLRGLNRSKLNWKTHKNKE